MDDLLQRVSVLRSRALALLSESSEQTESSGDNGSDAWDLRQQVKP